MNKILTITASYPAEFDKRVNEKLVEGWELVSTHVVALPEEEQDLDIFRHVAILKMFQSN